MHSCTAVKVRIPFLFSHYLWMSEISFVRAELSCRLIFCGINAFAEKYQSFWSPSIVLDVQWITFSLVCRLPRWDWLRITNVSIRAGTMLELHVSQFWGLEWCSTAQESDQLRRQETLWSAQCRLLMALERNTSINFETDTATLTGCNNAFDSRGAAKKKFLTFDQSCHSCFWTYRTNLHLSLARGKENSPFEKKLAWSCKRAGFGKEEDKWKIKEHTERLKQECTASWQDTKKPLR